MSSPWKTNARGSSSRVVPLEKARAIAEERDRLASEVERLRGRVRELEGLLESERGERATESEDREQLRRRAEEAEERVRELKEYIDEELSAQEDVPEPSQEEELTEKLRERVASLQNEIKRLRRRSDEIEEEARRQERIRILSGLGNALESIERGLSMQPEGPEREGLEAIYSQLLEFLRREGAMLTGEAGDEMSPELHEALEVVEDTEAESGTIVEVARRGVVLEDGTVVLPAKVRVAA